MEREYHPQPGPLRAFRLFHGNSLDAEEANTSLSEFHDYEPRLEFDDSDLAVPSFLCPNDDALKRSTSDGTIEENFEDALADAPEVYAEIAGSLHYNGFADLAGTGCVEVVGDDGIGRRIIIISACYLPPSKEVHPDKFLRYLLFTLDTYVEQDYSVVYFHYGLTSKNKPPLSWLWKAYKAFDRKYKKNLKTLYLVHPTNFIRIVWQMLRPALSVKFGKKVMYVNYLHELQQNLDLDKIFIPTEVLEYDKLLLSKNPKAANLANKMAGLQLKPSNEKDEKSTVETVQVARKPSLTPPSTQQFGVSLQFIKANNVNMIDSIPPVVRQCIEYLSRPEALETEGLFRRSVKVSVIKELQRACNRGEPISFRDDPHNAAVLLKTFLRDLEEPLLSFDIYEDILQFHNWANDDKPRQVKLLILERLPLDNYRLLKYIFQFLWQVQDRSCVNKMTVNNLAVVFGPNLAWPPVGQMTLQAIGPINSFTDYLLQNHKSIFFI